MPLPSIRRASRRLGVASLIHPSSSSARRDRPGPPAAGRPPGQRPGQAAPDGPKLPAPRAERQAVAAPLQTLPSGTPRCVGTRSPGTIAPPPSETRRRCAVSSDPNYDAATDTYRQIYRGHDNASAVTNNEGLTVYFDPDTQRRAGLLDRQLQGLLRGPPDRGRRVRGHAAGQGAGERSRRRWTSTPRPSAPASGSPSSTRPSPRRRAPTMIASGPLPEGTIGKTLAIGLTCTSTSAGPSAAKASASASSSSPGSWTVGRVDPVRPRDALEAGLEAREARAGVAALPEELLPLADHAQVAVVQDHDLDRQAVHLGGRELLEGHLERAVAGDHDDQLVGQGHLGAEGRRQAEAHRAEAARGDPAPRPVEEVVLGGPHLVLADVGAPRSRRRG